MSTISNVKELHSSPTELRVRDLLSVDHALAELSRIRARLYDPDAGLTDNECNALVEQEAAMLQAVGAAKAETFETIIEKFALLSGELCKSNVPRPVRVLAASLCSDVTEFLNA
ncbi:hypothetical protein [Roseibium sp.]|uniref:hypothetical protein n=1 Tax=Roseibium sp. TaxID=1936156 RepID=UPI00391C5517